MLDCCSGRRMADLGPAAEMQGGATARGADAAMSNSIGTLIASALGIIMVQLNGGAGHLRL